MILPASSIEKPIEASVEKARGGESPEIPKFAPTEGSELLPEPMSDVSESEKDDVPSLPFSKARSIALVATLTGASFLNVGVILTILRVDHLADTH
jgi:hypothetical protein